MKKILIAGLMLITVMLFFSDEKELKTTVVEHKEKIKEVPKIKTEVVVHYDEVKIYREANVSIVAGVNVDVLRERNVTINAKIIEEDSIGSYYIWEKGKKIVGHNNALNMNFPLGKHTVSALIYSEEQELLKKEIIEVTAWNYRKERRNYYNEESGDLEEFYENIYDYHEHLVLSLSQESRTEYLYNEEGWRVEEHLDNYEYPENSKNVLYTYHDNGNEDTVEEYDYEGSFVSREIYIYDENGTLTDFKYEYPLSDEEKEENYSEIEEGNYTYVEENKSEEPETEDVYKEDEEGRTIYQKVVYDDEVYIDEYVYDEEGYLKEEISTFKGKETLRIKKENYEYNDNGRRSKYRVYISENDIVTCDGLTSMTYDKDGMQKSTIKEVFDGVCGYDEMEVGKKEIRFFYDKDGNIIEKRVVYYSGDDPLESNSQLTVVTSYMNELD